MASPNEAAQFKSFLENDEEKAWEEVEALRSEFNPGIFDSVRTVSRTEAVERAASVVHETLLAAKRAGLDFSRSDPEHGTGHLARDYANSLVLLKI